MKETQVIYKVLNIPVPETADLERTLIASLASSPDMFGEVFPIINTPDTFTNPFCREVWEYMTDCFNKGNEFEIATLMQRFPTLVKEIGEKIADVGGTLSTREFAINLRNGAAQRRAYIAAGTFLATATDRCASEQEILASVEGFARSVEGPAPLQTDKSLPDIISIVKEANARMAKAREEGKTIRITSGFSILDEAFYGGYKPGQLVILAARPSVGKTAVMLQMAKAAAAAGNPVQIFSLEMQAEELAERILYSTGELTPGQLSYGRVSDAAFHKAEVKLDKLPIYVNDFSRSLDDITSRITLAVKKGRCGIAFIDYLGLIRDTLNFGNAKLYQVIARVTGTLKAVAKRLEIPIVLLCQLNRDAAREGRKPELFDLRDSGSIEQDADIVMMLESRMATEGSLLVWLRKNRSGKREMGLKLRPDEFFSRFEEIEVEEETRSARSQKELLAKREEELRQAKENIFNGNEPDEDDNLPF